MDDCKCTIKGCHLSNEKDIVNLNHMGYYKELYYIITDVGYMEFITSHYEGILYF